MKVGVSGYTSHRHVSMIVSENVERFCTHKILTVPDKATLNSLVGHGIGLPIWKEN